MQPITQLSLPQLADGGSEVCGRSLLAVQRRSPQHSWLAKSSFGYIVTEYAAMKELLGMDDKLRVAHEGMIDLMNARGSRWGAFQLDSILGIGGERHKRIRDVLAPTFTPRAANEHRWLMRQVISRLLDEWAPKAGFDFEEFAAHFPITVMFSLIGASPEALPMVRTSLETLGLELQPHSRFPAAAGKSGRGHARIRYRTGARTGARAAPQRTAGPAGCADRGA